MDQLGDVIPGYGELAAFMGGEFPSFHDSEVLTLLLDRAGPSRLSIQLIGRRRVQHGDGSLQWVPLENTVVTFILEGVEDLELVDFSSQNVIFELTLEQVESGIRLKMWPCYGITGWFSARQIKVEFHSNPEVGD